jgi:hypothetical protein
VVLKSILPLIRLHFFGRQWRGFSSIIPRPRHLLSNFDKVQQMIFFIKIRDEYAQQLKLFFLSRLFQQSNVKT